MSERELFVAALMITEPAERTAWLDRECGDDAALRQRIDVLLRAFNNAGSLLENSAVGVGRTSDEPITEAAGTVIGPYKLLQQIGEGGMGVVWMAEQTQPVQRKVALKVIKPGMDSRQVIARFEAERQALALMDHVNIARVFDGGTIPGIRSQESGVSKQGAGERPLTPDPCPLTPGEGRPYFVMELVHGIPITKYCDDNHLTPRERLELFVPVCQAIQHAHQKGIIHRDIKPSNVMVTLYDGKPVPKVIDFGVAKATEHKLTERTLFTQYGTMVGTLEYMSPEQAEMSALGVDTRSDIYSLGVLLYELLTGSTPLTHKRMKEAAYAEILRMIKEEEPPKPSTRLSDSGEAMASISANRHTEPAKLTKLVRGELDWIVMKTLEKDRNRRYETANGFAQDVQRYLADEAVQACPPSMAYRLRKFIRRNKGPVLAAALMLAALVIGIVGATWGMIRATHAEADALREAGEKTAALGDKEKALGTAKANEIQAKAAQKDAQENLKDALAAVDLMLRRVAEERLANVPHMEPVRRELMQDALGFYQKFLRKNGADPVVRRETALAHRRLADIHRNLGQYAEAETSYGKAFALFAELAAVSPLETGSRHELSLAHLELADCLHHLNKGEEQMKSVRRAVEIAEQLVKEHPINILYADRLFDATFHLAVLLASTRPEESERMLRRNLTLTNTPFLRANIHRYLGILLTRQKQAHEAEQATRQALKEYEDLATTNPSVNPNWVKLNIGEALLNLANLTAADGRLQEAEQISGRAIAVLDKLASEFPAGPNYRHYQSWAHHGRASILRKFNRTAEAEQAYRRAVELFGRLANDFPAINAYPQTAFELGLSLGQFLLEAGRAEDALDAYCHTIDHVGKPTASTTLSHWQGLLRTHLELGRLLTKTGNKDKGERAYLGAAEIAERLEKDFAGKPEFRRDLAQSQLQSAHLFRDAGALLAAQKTYGHAITHYRKLATEFPKVQEYRASLGYAHNDLAWLIRRANDGRLPLAEKEYCQSLALFEALAADFPTVIDYQVVRVELLGTIGTLRRDRGDLAGARPLMEAANRGALRTQQTFLRNPYRQRLRYVRKEFGRLLEQLDDFAEAEQCLRQLIADCEVHLAESLAGKRTDTHAGLQQWREWKELLGTRLELVHMLARSGKYQEAQAAYRDALAVRDRLEKELSGKAEYRRDLALSHFHAGLALTERYLDGVRTTDEVIKSYRMALGHAQAWVAAQPRARDARDLLANVNLRLAATLRWDTAHGTESEKLRQALGLYDQLAAEFPDYHEFAYAAAESAEVLAVVELYRQQYARAEDLFRQAIIRSEKLVRWPDHLRTAHEFAISQFRHGANHMYLGETLTRLGRPQEAAASFELAVPLLDKATRHPAVLQHRTHLGDCHRKLGVLLIGSGRTTEGEKQLRLALETSTTSASRNNLAWKLATHPDPRVHNGAANLAVQAAKGAVDLEAKNGRFVNTLGTAYYRAGDWKASIETLERAETMQLGSMFSYNAFFLAMAHWQLGNKEEARGRFDRAVEWMEKNRLKNDELRRFRAEAARLMKLEPKND